MASVVLKRGENVGGAIAPARLLLPGGKRGVQVDVGEKGDSHERMIRVTPS